jgi:glyoxylase-like metal-dependent hydrolase (beta-lactamase superfamily II)
MQHFIRKNGWLALAWLLAGYTALAGVNQLTSEGLGNGLQLVRGAINGARLERGGKALAIYGDPREAPPPADTVLLTHHRRDVVWAANPLVASGAKAIVPAAEQAQFTDVAKFWSEFTTKRFHDYAQQTTKVLGEPMPVAQAVRGGDTFTWEGLPIHVLDTPGYTRGAVTYWFELEGRRIAFTGDLIYGDGKLFDLYSFQDAIPAAKIGGYHGYAARLADLLTSLAKVAAAKPDLLIPARGPVIRNPAQAIETLTSRVRALYANYLSIDALRWYFKDEHILAKARRVLGPEAKVDWMPMGEMLPALPPWIVPINNSRLILAADKTGFLVDCGGRHIIDELKKLQAAGKLTTIEHVFITHYHDDHTDQVSKLIEATGATVHASRENIDILEHPGAYRLPCLTANPIHVSGRASSGARWRWKEFQMTLDYFPGQTLYHDALRVTRDSGERFYFIGDSFTPSGIDDYCLQNRNLLREGLGYFYCLEHVQQSAPGAWLINEHVEPAFRFTDQQIDRMLDTLRRRVALLQALFPWDDPNFGLDESWARFYPYAIDARPGQTLTLRLRLMNHSPAAQSFDVRVRPPTGWKIQAQSPNPIRINAREEGSVEARVSVPENAAPGVHLLTADLRWGDWDLRAWTEAMVSVANRPPD